MTEQKRRGILGVTSFHKDALEETANICTATASKALSVLINKPVLLEPPELFLVKAEVIPKIIPKSHDILISAYSPIKGDLNGNLAVFFNKAVATQIHRKVSNSKSKKTLELTKESIDVLQEIGNIMFGNYLTGIDLLLGRNVIHNPPHIISTFGDSLIDFITLNLENMNNCFILKTNIFINQKKKERDGFFIFILNIDSVRELIRLIQKKIRK